MKNELVTLKEAEIRKKLEELGFCEIQLEGFSFLLAQDELQFRAHAIYDKGNLRLFLIFDGYLNKFFAYDEAMKGPLSGDDLKSLLFENEIKENLFIQALEEVQKIVKK